MNHRQMLVTLLLAVTISYATGATLGWPVGRAQQPAAPSVPQPTIQPGSPEYQVVPVANLQAGRALLAQMSSQGWELTAVQTNLSPKLMPAQAPQANLLPQLPPNQAPSWKAEAYYFFKRLKR
jgi:hypothetical protein